MFSLEPRGKAMSLNRSKEWQAIRFTTFIIERIRHGVRLGAGTLWQGDGRHRDKIFLCTCA